jgi:acetyl-CoA carboxylase biotin carboxylase subunit
MGDTALAAARAAGGHNAGTGEFHHDRAGAVDLQEFKTRLQVEHPVTEFVTGIDLVQWQIRIAAGEPLDLPEALEPRGWAIECRITSEDPAQGFLPSTGRVAFMHLPAGPGVRWDGGIEPGSSIGLHYDSLLGKLIVWARTRDQAIERMRRALHELRIVGVETSRESHLRVLENADYRSGNVNIQWLEQQLAHFTGVPVPDRDSQMAAVAAALLEDRRRSRASLPSAVKHHDAAPDRWRLAARLDALR